MILRRLTDAFRKQDWFTVGIETLIVVLGVFHGLQSAREVARALKRRNAQVSGRTFEWLQYKAGAMN